MTPIYHFLLYLSLSFFSTSGEALEKDIQGIYVIRYAKVELDRYFQEEEQWIIDFESVDYFLPLAKTEEELNLLDEIINQEILMKDQKLFLLPDADLQTKVDFLFEQPPQCETQFSLPDKLVDRNFFMASLDSDFVYALYHLRGKVIERRLENNFENRILLNAKLSVPKTVDYFSCNFIWKLEELKPYTGKDNDFVKYRATK